MNLMVTLAIENMKNLQRYPGNIKKFSCSTAVIFHVFYFEFFYSVHKVLNQTDSY